MKSFWIILTAVIGSGTTEVIGELNCTTDCACCASAPDGSRILDDICRNADQGQCNYGCLDGYYGGRCTNKCPVYCQVCGRHFTAVNNNLYQICYTCADGYYNGTGVTNCSTPCPTNCLDSKCDRTSGRCLDGCISDNWTGNKCDMCAFGYYGTNCIPCPVYCKDDICDAGHGGCTNGCKDIRYTGTKCDKCLVGRYGADCDETCPANCHNGVCGRNSGTCTSGCIGNFTGDHCEKCNHGYYGENCVDICKNCHLDLCDRTTGVCNNCDNGKYGQYCNLTCSSGCKTGLCFRDNATCTLGCRTQFSGDKCCVRNKNCELCDTVKTCSKCRTGYYGNECDKTCPANCAGRCDNLSGDCIACRAGYHGNKCTEVCSDQCHISTCSQQSGKCKACRIGYYGDACNKTCPVTCLRKICYQDGGKCGDCVVGYHGVWCDLDCTTYCINETCIQETGACLYGCKQEYKDKCSQNIVVARDNVGIIIGGVVGGFSAIIIVLVGYIIITRCRSRETRENHEPGPNNGVELEEQHDYEYVYRDLGIEEIVYSDLQSDGAYINTHMEFRNQGGEYVNAQI